MEEMENKVVKERINSALEFEDWQIRNQYKCVWALFLYWEDSDCRGFQEEARALGELFSRGFHFNIDFYPIPSEQSHVTLDTRINLLLTEHGDANNLLIIHYGGHGDSNDDDGEQKLAVWAAHAIGGPTVTWSIIQPKFGEVQADVLLLLDCCFAAQAARAKHNRAIPRNLELLTACAMGVKTISPGPHSFTTQLIKQLRNSLEATGCARISDVFNMLARRDSGYKYTPVHFSGLGDGRSTICLEPFDISPDKLKGKEQEAAWLTLRVSLREILTDRLTSDIICWLKGHPKRRVSKLTVEDVVSSTGKVHQFIHDESRGRDSAPRFNQLSPSAKQDILLGLTQLRSHLVVLATQLKSASIRQESKLHEEEVIVDLPATTPRDSSATLIELENSLVYLQSIIQRGVMTLPDLHESRETLLEAIEDTVMQDLDFVPLLERRLKACFPFEMDNSMKINHHINVPDTSPAIFRRLFSEELEDLGSVLVEYKYYEKRKSTELLENRVSILADLLQSRGHSDFYTLRCLRWFHEPNLTRFGLVFQHPARCGGFKTLREIIETNDTRSRPTLRQRFAIAKRIGEALLKWHMSANWVHQDIASHNIYFFKPLGSVQLDFSNPYLCGFEFSRPSDRISDNPLFENFELDIYRHPSRQGMPEENHTKRHDLYAYGVLLLEVGVWRLIGSYFDKERRAKLGRIKSTTYIRQIAERSLGHCMGLAYERATLRCLRTDLGAELDDAIESKLAKSFQDLVLQEIYQGTTLD